MKPFWATFIDIWRFLSGHTACDGPSGWFFSYEPIQILTKKFFLKISEKNQKDKFYAGFA